MTNEKQPDAPEQPQHVQIAVKCGTCACWKKIPTEINRGVCLALPPTPVLLTQPGFRHPVQQNIRPGTKEEDGCLALWRVNPALIGGQPAGQEVASDGVTNDVAGKLGATPSRDLN